MRCRRRITAAGAVVAMLLPAGPASPATPGGSAPIAPGPVPRGPVAPLAPTEQRTACQALITRPGSDFQRPGHPQRLLDYVAGWQFSRGAGQTVAVIDTGVAQHPRLGGVRAGGDYVSDGDGTADCDAHGTLVAGIIAGRPAAGDAFAGVAPAASILAIRQSSLAFEASDRRSDAQGNVTTMAYAVTRAVDLGATVVNISQVACGPAGADLGDASLGRAVRYAFERNVVVVAAAGNVDSGSACSAQNEAAPPVTTASPARFSDYVLAVGATEPTGRPAAFSLAGPWVAVAAPGTDVTSLDPRSSGLVNGRITRSGHGSIDGTSFAAPYVAGLAAAVRARFPHLSAGEVMHRITSTARHPAGGWNPAVGFGVIDPVAALTTDTPIGELPAGIPDVRPRAGRVLEAMREPDRDERPAVVALTGCGVALGVVLGVRMAGSRRR